MNCPICSCKYVTSSGGTFHSEEHEINGVPMTVLVIVGETLRCPDRHKWASPINLEEAVAERKARMQEKFTLAAAIDWLKKFSRRDLLMGEQNYARLLLKALPEN